MANDESPLFRDIFFHSTAATLVDNKDDSCLHFEYSDNLVQGDHDTFLSSFDIFASNYSDDDAPILESMSMDQFFSNSTFELQHTTITIPALSPPAYVNSHQQHIVRSCSSTFDHHPSASLLFINPPEPVYHVRYLSEIMNTTRDGNQSNSTKKMKKNVSGRYLKGTHGRHVRIALPSILPENCHLFIRVTRLTVPYHDTSFIHPYPLLYSHPKKKSHPDVIIKDSSIYYKLNKEDICTRSKHFPNIILARLKQCHLKHMDSLYPFKCSQTPCPFIGNSAKSKIATYQLKKSHLDFRLAVRCNRTGEFFDLNISCRSNELLEEEGTECKKSSLRSSL